MKNNDSRPESERTPIWYWTPAGIFAALVVFESLSNRGLIGAYLAFRNWFWLLFCCCLVYAAWRMFEPRWLAVFQTKHDGILGLIKVIFGFSPIIIWAFFMDSRVDNYVLSKLTGLPLAVFTPCDAEPLPPDLLVVSKELFGLRMNDDFDCEAPGVVDRW